jgi:hypothetical protein
MEARVAEAGGGLAAVAAAQRAGAGGDQDERRHPRAPSQTTRIPAAVAWGRSSCADTHRSTSSPGRVDGVLAQLLLPQHVAAVVALVLDATVDLVRGVADEVERVDPGDHDPFDGHLDLEVELRPLAKDHR